MFCIHLLEVMCTISVCAYPQYNVMLQLVLVAESVLSQSQINHIRTLKLTLVSTNNIQGHDQ